MTSRYDEAARLAVELRMGNCSHVVSCINGDVQLALTLARQLKPHELMILRAAVDRWNTVS